MKNFYQTNLNISLQKILINYLNGLYKIKVSFGVLFGIFVMLKGKKKINFKNQKILLKINF